MSVGAERSATKDERMHLGSRVLLVSTVACLVGAGLLLWARQGDAVFSDLVLAALAWCF